MDNVSRETKNGRVYDYLSAVYSSILYCKITLLINSLRLIHLNRKLIIPKDVPVCNRTLVRVTDFVKIPIVKFLEPHIWLDAQR
jgi:hypothetical protein